jgi:hypothetical protein
MSRIYYAVVTDDPLDSGGRIVGGNPRCTLEGPDGRMRERAYLGHQAWCETCQSLGVIQAGSGIADYLRGWDLTINKQEAVDGDIVICKCKRHPRLVAVYGRRSSYEDTLGGGALIPQTTGHSAGPAVSKPYDEQFTLKDSDGVPLANVHYRIIVDGKRVVTGTTNANGKTVRVATEGALYLKLQLEK